MLELVLLLTVLLLFWGGHGGAARRVRGECGCARGAISDGRPYRDHQQFSALFSGVIGRGSASVPFSN